MRIGLVCTAVIVFNFSFAQVSLQNGFAEYQVPLFSFTDAKSGLATEISLNYSSGGGLLARDLAQNTGQGWNLVTGGSIVRKQNGEPDDQFSLDLYPPVPVGNSLHHNESIACWKEGNAETYDYIEKYFPNGFLYSEFPLALTDDDPLLKFATPRELALIPRFRNSMDKRWKLSRRSLTDREQDVFMYNFNGKTGEFVIGKDGKVSLLNEAGIIITAVYTDLSSQNIRTRITGFKVIDESGMIYRFDAFELSEVMRVKKKPYSGNIVIDGPPEMDTLLNEPTGNYTIQKWLLTEIQNPGTQDRIIFHYRDIAIDILSETIPSYQYTEGQQSEVVSIYQLRAKGKFKRISDITMPDGHEINFVYDTSATRVDVPDDPAVSEIKISINGRVISKYRLSYGYFLRKTIRDFSASFEEKEKRFARLCLLSCQKFAGNITEPPYSFSYYTGSESSDPKDMVPPFDCYAIDHWGYYNKATNIDIEKENPGRQPVISLMTQAAQFREPGDGCARFGLIKTIRTPFGGTLSFQYEQNDCKDSDNPQATKKYGGVRVSRVTRSGEMDHASDIVTDYKYILTDGKTSGWGYEAPFYNNSFLVKFVKDPDGYKYGGLMASDISTGCSKFMIKAFVNSLIKLSAKAMIGNAIAEGAAAPLIGTGPLTAIISFIVGGLIDRIYMLFDPYDYLTLVHYGFFPLLEHNSVGLHYSRVEMINSSLPSPNGKTVYQFTAPENVRAMIPALSYPFGPRERFPAWKYGLPEKTQFYDQAGGLVKELSNQYIIHEDVLNDQFNQSCKISPLTLTSAVCEYFTDHISVSDFAADFYYPTKGWAELKATTEKNFTAQGLVSQSTVNYEYNRDHLLSKRIATESNGDQIISKNYYPGDYNDISPAIAQMKLANMVNAPISTETWLRKQSGLEYLADATVNEYQKLESGDVKIKSLYKLETKEPLPLALIGTQQPNTLIRNQNYFKEQLSFHYRDGVLVAESTPAGRMNSKYYDYGDRLVTAKIVNASIEQTAYSSFETASKGNWNYDQTLVTDEKAATGLHAFRLPSEGSAITNYLALHKKYTLSFWCYGESPFVIRNNSTSGTAAVKSYNNLKTGWIYYEFNIEGPCFLSIDNISLRVLSKPVCYIDELRLYPADARMSTISYDSQLRKKDECDVNNHIMHYRYDAMGRLTAILDEKYSLLKTYEYHLKQN
jgi:hypothetical protein